MIFDPITDKLSRAAVLEQLAEECAELAKAALKLARIDRNENPTPVTETEAMDNLIEEIADVQLCIVVLGAYTGGFDTDNPMREKYFRWIDRLNKKAGAT